MSDVVRKHKTHPSADTTQSGWLGFANSKLALLRFTGTDQNPHGIRDIFGAAETAMRRMEIRLAELEERLTEYEWRETARQQERSRGTM